LANKKERNTTKKDAGSLKKDFPFLISELQQNQMLPAIIFVFNRLDCSNLVKAARHHLISQKKEKDDSSSDDDDIVERSENEDESSDETDDWETVGIEENNWLNNIFETSPDCTLVKKPVSTQDASYYLDRLDKDHVPDDYYLCLPHGISYHHSGCSTKMKTITECLFRQEFLSLVVSTTTLAQGIHMPCKTVVFAGDNRYLDSLSYHQCAGRAGRRGFDTDGNIVFFGIGERKINTLMNSDLPLIVGNNPTSMSLILKMFALCSKDVAEKNRQEAINRAYGCLKHPLISKNKESLDSQLQLFFLYATDFLYRTGFLDETAQPVGLSGIITHLSYLEPSNFAFCHLLKDGVLQDLVERDGRGQISQISINNIMAVTCYVFTRQFNVNSKNQLGRLSPPSDAVMSSLRKFNNDLTLSRCAYIQSLATLQTSPRLSVHLPLSGGLFEFTDCTTELDPIAKHTGILKIDYERPHQLPSNIRKDFFVESLPTLNLEANVNGYALEFFMNGDPGYVIGDYGIMEGDCHNALRDVNMLLISIYTSLKQIGCSSQDYVTDDIIEAFRIISNKYNTQFCTAYGGRLRRFGSYKLHTSDCFACSLIVETDVIKLEGLNQFEVRGELNCSSEYCVILLYCEDCRKKWLTSCVGCVSDKMKSLRSFSHFSKKDHQVRMIIASDLKKTNRSVELLMRERSLWQKRLNLDPDRILL